MYVSPLKCTDVSNPSYTSTIYGLITCHVTLQTVCGCTQFDARPLYLLLVARSRTLDSELIFMCDILVEKHAVTNQSLYGVTTYSKLEYLQLFLIKSSHSLDRKPC